MTTPVVAEQQALVDAGAAPVPVDAEALLKQIQELQAQMAVLHQAQGVPANPVEAAANDLKAHVDARAAQSPAIDFEPLHTAVKDFLENGTKDIARLVTLAVDDFVSRWRHLELAYLPELARKLETAVIKNG